MKTITTLVLILSSLMPLRLLAQSPCKHVVGYYPNWQWYDRNKLVNPQTIQYAKYTILNYCFMKPEPDGTISLTDPWADENLLLGQPDWQNGGYIPNTSIIDLAHQHGIQILPSIGGWTLSENFPNIAADPVKRATFAQACVNLIQTYEFDGIDLDWEYPGFPAHGGTPQDKVNFNLLLQEVRSAIDAYGQTINKPMLLTAAVGAANDRMDDVDWPVVSQYLDLINLMSYDFFGTWDAVTNHNAPLEAPAVGDSTFNGASAIYRLVHQYGVNPQQITLGMPFYGRSVKTSGTPGLHVSHNGTVDNVTFGADQGTPLYYNVLASMNQFTEHWDAQAKVPYLTGNNGLNTFLSYDNPHSIAEKARHVVDHNLGGAIIWEITGDYLETSPGSGVISGTPMVDSLNYIFCNYTGNTSGGGGTVSIEEQATAAIQMYPNPATEVVYFDFVQPGHHTIEVFNSMGELIVTQTSTSAQAKLNVNCFSPGVYFVTLTNARGEKEEKILIRVE